MYYIKIMCILCLELCQQNIMVALVIPTVLLFVIKNKVVVKGEFHMTSYQLSE